MFIRRTNTETPVLWPTDEKSCLIRNDPGSWERLEAGREGDDRGRDGWQHQLYEHEFEEGSRDAERQGSLACCSPWVHRARHNWVILQQQF